MWYWCEASGLAFLRQTSRRQQQLLRRQRLAVPEETLRGGRAGPPRNQKQQENVPDTNKQQLAATSGHRWDPPSTTHPLAIGSINTLTSPGVILSSDPDESDYFNWKGAKWRPAFCLCPRLRAAVLSARLKVNPIFIAAHVNNLSYSIK